jgi:apolipoprotein D and lipocalin family protein
MSNIEASEPKPRGMSKGVRNFWIVFCVLIVVGIVAAYVIVHFMAKKTEDDAQNPPKLQDGVTPVTIVPIDLPKYLGKWYEIARLPNEFEDFSDSSCSMVTAEYAAIQGDAKTISVKNSCTVRSGAAPTLTPTLLATTTSNGGLVTTTTTSTGTETNVNIVSGQKISDGQAIVNPNGTLAVTFVTDPLPKFYGNYTVIYRKPGDAADDPWRTSVVVGGTGKIEYAWILHREPTMPAAEFVEAMAALIANGVDVSKLIQTVQA